MNIHPLFVHFPIGLLVVYALMELVPARFHRNFAWWQGAKMFILSLGMLAIAPTLVTGDMASDVIPARISHEFVETHEKFALITFGIFFILASAYLVHTAARRGWGNAIVHKNAFFMRVWNTKQRIAHWITDTPLRQLLSLAGLISIVITGGLGASIVYGPNIDPFVSFIYGLFF